MPFLIAGWAVTSGVFVYALLRITDRHSRQVQTLLDRIQKPELAVARSIASEDPDAYKVPAHVAFDSDDDYWEHKETLR